VSGGIGVKSKKTLSQWIVGPLTSLGLTSKNHVTALVKTKENCSSPIKFSSLSAELPKIPLRELTQVPFGQALLRSKSYFKTKLK